jgi:hypothetical protein
MGVHKGVHSRGQQLVSDMLAGFKSLQFGDGVFCDGRQVAIAPVGYTLTVPRERVLTSMQRPKVLDERARPMQPARTFFIERLDGVAAPPEVARELELSDLELRDFDIKDFIPLTLTFESNRFAGDPSSPNAGSMAAIHNSHTSSTGYAVDAQVIALGSRDVHNMALWDSPPPLMLPDEVRSDFYPTNWMWRFYTFWHPQADGIRRILEARGLARAMRYENQALTEGTDLPLQRARVDHFKSAYRPTVFVDPRWPRDVVDFTVDGSHSEYNWEFWFHNLLFEADIFDETGLYAEAEELYGLLLDTSSVGRPGAWSDPSLYYTAPVRHAVSLEGDLEREGVGALVAGGHLREDLLAQIERVKLNPYQPHLLALGWPAIYARALRIRYVKHLIREGEHHFRRAYLGDDRSDLEIASARFDLAARCLGPSEGPMAPTSSDEITCYASLASGAGARPADGVGQLEAYIPVDALLPGSGDEAAWVASARQRFCVPPNGALDELRAIVATRLLNLRSCQNIEGVSQALSLYGQRIDPAILVRATAEGINLDVVLGLVSGARPTMYFQALWQRAMQACERSRAFDEALVGAQVAADAEESVRRQNDLEIQAHEAKLQIDSQRVDHAKKLTEALDRTIESAQARYEFYNDREQLSSYEKLESDLLRDAGVADARAAGASRSASHAAWFPTAEFYADGGWRWTSGSPPSVYFQTGAAVRSRFGGETAVQVFRADAEGHQHNSAHKRVDAGVAGQRGNRDRRREEWKHLAEISLKDEQRAKADRDSAVISVVIAEFERDLQRQRIDDAKAMRTFHRSKTTSMEFHSRRADRHRALLYQQHRLAFDLVLQSRAALIREHGLDEPPFIADPWGSDGVGAAAALMAELEQQQRMYRESWRREQEHKLKYSLAGRDPLAFLQLIQQGKTLVSMTEGDWDDEAAGWYFRRLRRISVDVPAVRGPYNNVNATITQVRGEKRLRPFSPTDGDYARDGADALRFRDDLTTGDCIVTNTGIQDDGRVEQRQDPEHPPPFAMNGAIATFLVELPPRQNHFERITIPDFVLTAVAGGRRGGEAAAAAGIAARRRYFTEVPQPVMVALHSSFSNAWHRFVDGYGAQESTLTVTFDEALVDMRLRPISRITHSNLYLAVSEGQEIAVVGGDATGVLSMPPSLQPKGSHLDDPHFTRPIHRLQLTQPLQLGVERSIRFERGHEAARPTAGWLICWVQGAGETR